MFVYLHTGERDDDELAALQGLRVQYGSDVHGQTVRASPVTQQVRIQ